MHRCAGILPNSLKLCVTRNNPCWCDTGKEQSTFCQVRLNSVCLYLKWTTIELFTFTPLEEYSKQFVCFSPGIQPCTSELGEKSCNTYKHHLLPDSWERLYSVPDPFSSAKIISKWQSSRELQIVEKYQAAETNHSGNSTGSSNPLQPLLQWRIWTY